MSVGAVSKGSSLTVAHQCAECGRKDAISSCAHCALTYYCSAGCIRADWPKHKNLCRAQIIRGTLNEHILPPLSDIALSFLSGSEVSLPEECKDSVWNSRLADLKASGGILREFATALEQLGMEKGKAAKKAYDTALKWVKRFPEECDAGMDMASEFLPFDQIVRAGEKIKDWQLYAFYEGLARSGPCEEWRSLLPQLERNWQSRSEFAAAMRRESFPPFPFSQIRGGFIPAELIPTTSLSETEAGDILLDVCTRKEPVEPYSIYPVFQNIPLRQFERAFITACDNSDLENVQALVNWPQTRNLSTDERSSLFRKAMRTAGLKYQWDFVRELKKIMTDLSALER